MQEWGGVSILEVIETVYAMPLRLVAVWAIMSGFLLLFAGECRDTASRYCANHLKTTETLTLTTDAPACACMTPAKALAGLKVSMRTLMVSIHAAIPSPHISRPVWRTGALARTLDRASLNSLRSVELHI